MHNVLRFGLLGLLVGQLALGVGLHGARALHALPMREHGTHQPMGLPSQMWGALKGIAALSASNIWAVGNFYNESSTWQTLIEHWDGSHWSRVPSPSPGKYYSELVSIAALSASNIWAVGSFSDDENVPQALIEHWGGSHWSRVPSPRIDYSYLKSITALTGQNIWAVGNFDGESNRQTLTEHWDGSHWGRVSSPSFGANASELTGITALSASNIWTIGNVYKDNDGIEHLIEHWNGSCWSIVPSPSFGTHESNLASVAALTASNIWVVGGIIRGSNRQSAVGQALVEHWDGSHWSSSFGANYSNLTSIAALSASNIWAVGNFYNESIEKTLIEHWDGTHWSRVPSPRTDYSELESIMALSTSNIWTVGSDGEQMLIEHWDGRKWSIVPSLDPIEQ